MTYFYIIGGFGVWLVLGYAFSRLFFAGAAGRGKPDA